MWKLHFFSIVWVMKENSCVNSPQWERKRVVYSHIGSWRMFTGFVWSWLLNIKVLKKWGVQVCSEHPSSHYKAQVKLSSRRVLTGEAKVSVKIRAQMPTRISWLGLVECKRCSSVLLRKCCLWRKRADVTEGRKTNVWGNLMQEVYPYAGQKVLDHKYQSRGKEQWLLGPAGTTTCKRELNSYFLQLLCASWGGFWK